MPVFTRATLIPKAEMKLSEAASTIFNKQQQPVLKPVSDTCFLLL
jgi:hypothetical protein